MLLEARQAAHGRGHVVQVDAQVLNGGPDVPVPHQFSDGLDRTGAGVPTVHLPQHAAVGAAQGVVGELDARPLR